MNGDATYATELKCTGYSLAATKAASTDTASNDNASADSTDTTSASTDTASTSVTDSTDTSAVATGDFAPIACARCCNCSSFSSCYLFKEEKRSLIKN